MEAKNNSMSIGVAVTIAVIICSIRLQVLLIRKGCQRHRNEPMPENRNEPVKTSAMLLIVLGILLLLIAYSLPGTFFKDEAIIASLTPREKYCISENPLLK